MKKFIITLIILLISPCAWALDYNVYKLNNGQTVIIKEVKNNPIVIVDTWIKTGSINEDDTNNGVSHFLEHLFFKGTTNLSPGEFDKTLEAKGAITNAATSKDFTHYYIKIPAKNFDLAMKLHADMLLNPLIPRKELEKERKVVMEEIAKSKNDPEELAYDNLIGMIYTTHPYKREVIGTNQIISKITREEILDYYNKYYVPQNMVTIVIGDVNPEHVLETIKQEFKAKEIKCQKQSFKHEKPLTKKVKKVEYKNIQSGYMLIGFRAADVTNSDTYALDLLATILGDGRSSRFYQSIKEQKQLAYSIDAANATYKEDGFFLVSASFIPDNLEKLERAIFQEITKIKRTGVTQEQLNLAKNMIERDTYYSRESVSNIASQIGYTTVLSGNPSYYDEYLKNINKVSRFDIQRVANKYLSENKSATSIVLPTWAKKAEVTNTNKKISEPKLIKTVSKTSKYSLENGSTLLVTPNALNDIVAISIYAKGGNFVEPIPATASLMADVLLKGTKKYSSIELAQILEENGIKIKPSASADVFTIDVLTTKKQLDFTLNLLSEIINNANFNDYELEKAKNTKLNLIKKMRDLPMNKALENYNSMIYEGSIYSNGPKIYEKSIPKIELSNIIDYYNKIFYPKNITISINGNVDSAEVAPKLNEIFEAKKGENFSYEKFSQSIPEIMAEKRLTLQIKDLQTAWIFMGWQTCGLLSEKDYATLHVMNSLLGSGMSSRLFKNIRDKEGLAYQIGSSYSPKILKGNFVMYIGTNPKNVKRAQSLMLAEIEQLKKEFVSDKDLQEAKDKILGKHLLSLETNLDKASILGWFEASGRGFEFKDKYEKLINSVTASDIVNIANKYFTQNYVISIVEGK